MALATTNYRETHFPHPDLTPIIGQPNYITLNTLYNQIKANATSVYSNLGGGQHGHLGLVLTPTDYARISPVPYVRMP